MVRRGKGFGQGARAGSASYRQRSHLPLHGNGRKSFHGPSAGEASRLAATAAVHQTMSAPLPAVIVSNAFVAMSSDTLCHVTISASPELDQPEPVGGEEAGTLCTVGPVRQSDRVQWERLYRGYIAFYKRDEPQSFYDNNWARLLEDAAVHGLLARDTKDDSTLLGLVHFIPHPSMSGDVCYMQDLFTDPAARGKGIGTRLINAVVAWCRTKGAIGKVYWNTHESNPARKLYDAVGVHKGFVKYQIDV